MAVIFTLGLSAIGNTDQTGDPSLGTFMAGCLLFAMAAFAPLATYSFIHWAGDQGQSALYAVQQGTAGPSAIKERVEQAARWAAFDFTGSRGQSSSEPVVGDSTESPADDQTIDADGNESSSHWPPVTDIGPDSSPATAPSDTANTTRSWVDRSAEPGPDRQPSRQADNDGRGGETP